MVFLFRIQGDVLIANLKGCDIWDVVNVKCHEPQVMRRMVVQAKVDSNETPQQNVGDIRRERRKIGKSKKKGTGITTDGKQWPESPITSVFYCPLYKQTRLYFKFDGG